MYVLEENSLNNSNEGNSVEGALKKRRGGANEKMRNNGLKKEAEEETEE